MTWLTDPQIWISLFTLTALEIVLGIDNIIFISMAFAFGVEMLNLKLRKKQAKHQPVELHQPYRCGEERGRRRSLACLVRPSFVPTLADDRLTPIRPRSGLLSLV